MLDKEQPFSRRKFLKSVGATTVALGVTSALPVGARAHTDPQADFDLLKVGIDSEATGSLDVVTAQHTKATMHARDAADFLVNVDPDGLTLRQGLATNWKRNEDATTYEFKLREDVTFHDGTPFNAQAVKFNFDRIADFKAGESFAALGADKYERTEVLDDFTVRVVFNAPYVAFYRQLGTRLWFDSPTAVEKFGEDYGTEAFVSTGPFKVQKFNSGSGGVWIAERNNDYQWASPMYSHKGPPHAKRIEQRGITEPATRRSALESGQVDVAKLREGDVDPIRNDPRFKVETTPKAGTTRQLRLNHNREPLNDVRVRQALAHAIDRTALVNSTRWSGEANEALGVLSRKNMGVKEWPQALAKASKSFNPEKARQLLNNAGWRVGDDGIREKNGKKLTLKTVIPGAFEPEVLPISAMWKDIGVKMDIQKVSVQAWFEAMDKGNLDLTIGSNSGVGLMVIVPIFRTNGPENVWGISNSTVDKNLNIVRESTDQQKRVDAIVKAQAELLDQASVIPTVEVIYLFGMLKEVQGVFFPDFAWPSWYQTYVEGR